MAVRYYCSGFDVSNAFGHGLGDMFLKELKETKSIVYIPGSADRVEKAKEKYVPEFTKHFENVGIKFDKSVIVNLEMDAKDAQKAIREANFVMLMGGDPFKQKELCKKLGLLGELKSFEGIMLGFSAGAMLMSKYIIITPCSEEHPDFRIEDGLNLDGISIYPHNNIDQTEYPMMLVAEEETTYRKEDLIKVADEYGEYYLLQDYLREDELTDVSYIKSINGNLEFHTENNGRIWMVRCGEIVLV
ncbi:MAG: Type 1 glutamine amidotransferase-like domain-containing protein [Candidatus Saccharibacteria bacterium]|nr:Type 1 glutamine amidotransferase-like domain-containing protein [Candidatus Saccharibacteria bacterium]